MIPLTARPFGSQATASLTIASDDLPDLVVSNIVAPLDARSGGAIDVTWRVTNQGNITASGTWTDYVYLSNDATIGNDQLLGSFSFTGAITVGSSIDRTQSIFLPLTLNGEHRIIIQTNANNGLKERPGTGNNNTTIDDLPINIISNLANSKYLVLLLLQQLFLVRKLLLNGLLLIQELVQQMRQFGMIKYGCHLMIN